jgi:hypothetical protein
MRGERGISNNLALVSLKLSLSLGYLTLLMLMRTTGAGRLLRRVIARMISRQVDELELGDIARFAGRFDPG